MNLLLLHRFLEISMQSAASRPEALSFPRRRNWGFTHSCNHQWKCAL